MRFLPDQERWDRYPFLRQRFQEGTLPGNLTNPLRRIIGEIDGRPFIVRSSSLLEDSYRSAVTSIYESVIVPNQGTQEEGLAQLQDAIREMYAQVFNPQAIQYREKKKAGQYPRENGDYYPDYPRSPRRELFLPGSFRFRRFKKLDTLGAVRKAE